MYVLFLVISLFISKPEVVVLEPFGFSERMQQSENYLLIDTRRVEKYCNSRLYGAEWCGWIKRFKMCHEPRPGFEKVATGLPLSVSVRTVPIISVRTVPFWRAA